MRETVPKRSQENEWAKKSDARTKIPSNGKIDRRLTMICVKYQVLTNYFL